ncbi:hypothetical protein [Exiguobacterium flavidum]|uniref:hypothetical protein n=1 Tax=Exiguobacterium flavidum TaxID=2184695 RepID=UPI000DF8406F|nr:hypothetical protein [Exiguobacterium flavidum]
MDKRWKLLKDVTGALRQAGIPYTVGGSALLALLGLTQEVNDWDIATDAYAHEVARALDGFEFKKAESGDGPYASRYKWVVTEDGHALELFGHFAIKTDEGVCHLPALNGPVRDGIQYGAPEVWFVAYSLIGRTEKAALLKGWLAQNGADQDILDRLRQQPLPQAIRAELDFGGVR